MIGLLWRDALLVLAVPLLVQGIYTIVVVLRDISKDWSEITSHMSPE